MTQEEKQLLLKDLSMRLPYGVKVNINSPIEEQNSMELFDVNIEYETIGVSNDKWTFRGIPIIDNEDETKVIKPYLRPMSSMTEKEHKEYEQWLPDGYCTDTFDWLLSHHFDFRGLIQKRLAIEAPKDMYKTE